MNINKLLVILASAAEIGMGIFHFIWTPKSELALINPEVKNLYLLLSFSIGILLIFAGLVSLTTLKLYDTNIKYFNTVNRLQTLLWSGRVYLETILPVSVPIYSINHPSSYIMYAAFITAVMFLLSTFYKKNEQNLEK